MHSVLTDMITRFRIAQDRGVRAITEVLSPALGIRRPQSNREWLDICVASGVYKVRHVDRIGV